jgi:hypothetical protein
MQPSPAARGCRLKMREETCMRYAVWLRYEVSDLEQMLWRFVILHASG